MILKPEEVFSLSPIIPVLVVKQLKDVLPLVKSLKEAGIKIIEITLRTPFALEAIQQVNQEIPEMVVGAGTVVTPEQLHACIKIGAKFAISPGSTSVLLSAGKEAEIPFIPGVFSISELMHGMEFGYQYFKLFPADILGLSMLKTIYNVFPSATFCPTGGINENNLLDYLNLPNVKCVGGTWMISEQLIQEENWTKITYLCIQALNKIKFRG